LVSESWQLAASVTAGADAAPHLPVVSTGLQRTTQASSAMGLFCHYGTAFPSPLPAHALLR